MTHDSTAKKEPDYHEIPVSIPGGATQSAALAICAAVVRAEKSRMNAAISSRDRVSGICAHARFSGFRDNAAHYTFWLAPLEDKRQGK